MNSLDRNKDLNEIEASLKRRLDYEHATIECMRILLEPGSIDDILPKILDIVHKTVDNNRTYIFKNEFDPELGLCMSLLHEALSDGALARIGNPELQHIPYKEAAPALFPVLESRQYFAHLLEELDGPEKIILSKQGVLSVLIIPIFAGQDFWGFIGFDDLIEAREWDENDIKILTVVADGIGEFVSHRKAEDELKESEERYKALHNATFGGILIHDKGKILDCNQGLSDMTGYSKEELIEIDGLLLIAESYREIVMNNMLTGYEEPYESIGRHKDGTEYPLRLEARNIPYKGKKARVVEFRDITEQKESEKALRESEEKLSAMIENIADVIAIIDKDGINRYKSPNIERWMGWKPEEIINTPVLNNIHPDEKENVQRIFANLLDMPKTTVTSNTRYLCKDGSYKWIEFTATNLLDEPAIKGILLNYHDISERKEAEDSLRESERKFRNYLQSAPYGIFILDEQGNYLEVNKTACNLTGYDENELIHMNSCDLVAPQSLISAGESFDDLKIRGYTSVELQLRHKDGSTGWVKRDGAKLSDNRFILFASDITEKRRAEHSLIEAKMLAENNNRIKSEFLANMSHELRTPLTAVIGFSDILQEKVAGELTEKQLGYVENINKSGKHLLGIINEILDLSKVESGKMELECGDFDVSRIIDETLESMNLIAAKKNIELKLVNNINNGNIFADKIKFQQILYNLLTNAIKFTQENGEVLITIEKTDNGIQISVADNGIGIVAEMQEEIFSPFTQVDASSKRRYGGTGLGLALVQKFVEMHKGKIWLESEEGKGSTFTFTIENQR